ncbi:TolC family protein, partial [Candidatus Sumerlaeota bacterium]|nr:TolC family protein [Candidatus Sumerlaeota bacterium]
MKKYWINSTLASLCLLMAGGCWRVKTPPAWQYEVRPEVFAQGPPKPADAAVASSDVATTRTAVKIDPAAASGYENVPDQLKQLYGPNPLPLIQESVIEQTLAHNRDIKIQNFYLQTAELGLPLSKGIYDLLLEAKALANKDQTATASALSAAGERRRREYDLSVTQLTPSGARAQAGYMFTKVSQVFQFTTLNPAITQGLVFSLTQPLLRGFGPKATNVGIHIAQVNGRISAAQLEATIQDQIRSALDLYWNLLFEVQNYDVQVISYTAALDLLRINKAKVEAGILPPTEALQAQARAETRREAIITARQRVRDAEDRLKKLMFFQDNAPNWDLELKPEQELTWREVQIDPEGALAEALDERP